MRQTDIAIVGGLAGSTAAAMLGRAGIATVLVEPHRVHPAELRCEKLCAGPQLDRLRMTGLADAVLSAATPDRGVWVARFGHLIDQRPTLQQGIRYDAMVNTLRSAIPAAVETLHAKATSIATSAERQTLTLANGEQISARLVVLANGQSVALRHQLGIARRVISPCHSVSLGFDTVPIGRDAFAFPALTYFSERTIHRTAYLTLFPIGDAMRGNLFVYRSADDPWLRQFRREPGAALDACLPKLRRLIGDYRISGDIRIRPADLYVSAGHRQAGVVLVGDAFEAPCPGTGIGTTKVFTDVERLCNVYIPRWLASAGMDADKIAAFYDDPEKRACDAHAAHEAFRLRSITLDDSVYWRTQRWLRFFGRLGSSTARRAASLIEPRGATDMTLGPALHPDAQARDIVKALGFADVGGEDAAALRDVAEPVAAE